MHLAMDYILDGVGAIERFKQGSCPNCVGTIWTVENQEEIHMPHSARLSGEKPWEIIALKNSQGRGAKWSLFLWLCAQPRRMLVQPSGLWQRSDTSQSISFLYLMSIKEKCPETLTYAKFLFCNLGPSKVFASNAYQREPQAYELY